MEQNLPIIAKKILNLVRVAYYMVRKGILKSKLLLDLNMTMKRSKIVGSKAFHNLMPHHQHSHTSSSSSRDQHVPFTLTPHENEFSCSNSPAFPAFHLSKRKNHNLVSRAARMRPTAADEEAITATAVNMAMDMSNTASPYLPRFGRSPMVRPLRITDSPFPLRNMDEEETLLVNKAAEDFIERFYNDLKRQNGITE